MTQAILSTVTSQKTPLATDAGGSGTKEPISADAFARLSHRHSKECLFNGTLNVQFSHFSSATVDGAKLL